MRYLVDAQKQSAVSSVRYSVTFIPLAPRAAVTWRGPGVLLGGRVGCGQSEPAAQALRRQLLGVAVHHGVSRHERDDPEDGRVGESLARC